jgi:SpoVK/Ycf46/Vps4 family AAA+-type ATPase
MQDKVFDKKFESLTKNKHWTEYLLEKYPKIFKKNDLVVRTIAILLKKYYEQGNVSLKLPSIDLFGLIADHSEMDSTRISIRMFNAIGLFKKSKLIKMEGRYSIKRPYLDLKLIYMDLSQSKLTLTTNAIIDFFEFPIDFEKSYNEYRDQSNSFLKEFNRVKLGRIITPKRDFNDLILSEENRREIEGFITTIKNRDKLLAWGIEYSPRILIGGIIGVGKSLSAEVIANKLGMVLYRISSEDVVGSYLGDTAKNIANSFKYTQANSNKVILFIDEIEGIIAKRVFDRSSADNEIARAVNTFLSLMEEVQNIIIIGTTNKLHEIDKACLSRFTKIVWFDFPDSKMLKEIIRIHFKDIPISSDLDLKELSQMLFKLNFSGRDIRNLTIEIAQEMLENNSEELNEEILAHCIDRLEKNDFDEKCREYAKIN